MNRREWINVYYPVAKQISTGTGIFPEVIIAQAIIESSTKGSDGFFYPGTSILASRGNNYFGIKAGKSWKGDKITLPTNEYVNGKKITVNADFRKYDTPGDSFKDYIKFLKDNPRYRKAGVFKAKTPQEQTKALQTAGYATDPKYSDKLNVIINNVKSFLPKINTSLMLILGAILFLFNSLTKNRNQ